MKYSLVHGPNRSPTILNAGSDSPFGVVPFHQVISKGLLRAAEWHNLESEEWQKVSPFVDRALAGWSVPSVPGLDAWLDLARANGVFSYADSARCALEFISAHGAEVCRCLAGPVQEVGAIESAELWCIKEGHTASIWVATIACEVAGPPFRFVINVARDAEAGAELIAMASELSIVARRNPAAAVRVLGCAAAGNGCALPVLAASWIPCGYELHVLSHGRAVAIERFVGDAEDPRRTASVVVQGKLASDELWSAMLRSWISLGDWSNPRGPVLLPRVEINEGDWVFADGRAILCALTPGQWALSPSEAVIACLSWYANPGNRGRRIHWGNEGKASSILREARDLNIYPALTEAFKD